MVLTNTFNMKYHSFFKKVLISLMGFIIVLNCTSQTAKERRADHNEKEKLESGNNFESLSSLIHSRNFVFKSGMEDNGQVSSLYEKNEYGKSEIRINGSLVKITGLNSSEWWRTKSCSIDKWELTENPEELAYSISFIVRSGDSNTAVLMKVLSDKTAIVQFGGREFRGQVTRN